MSSDVGAVDDHAGGSRDGCQRAEDDGPAILPAPVSDAIVYTLPVSEVSWQVAAANTCPGDLDDRFHETPILQL